MEEEKIKPFFFCKFVTRARIRTERESRHILHIFGFRRHFHLRNVANLIFLEVNLDPERRP